MNRKVKIRIVNKFRFTFCLTLLMLLVFISFSAITGRLSASAIDSEQIISVEVNKGDTVWSIANEININYMDGKEDTRMIAYSIAEENELIDYRIYPNQKLKIILN